jgi:hypothetical protein
VRTRFDINGDNPSLLRRLRKIGTVPGGCR